MKKTVLYIFITAIIVLFTACSQNKISEGLSTTQKMAKADLYFERGKYNQAILYYTNIVYEKTSSITPLAQMKLAESYFKMNKFEDALMQYQDMIRLFPDYKDIGTVYYMISLCYYNESLPPYYTQGDTKNAIESFQTFIDRFPMDSRRNKALDYINKCNYRLLEKKYLNGLTYFRIYDYSAALMYFKEIISLANKNDLDKNSLYYSSVIYINQDFASEAREMAAKLIKRYPDSQKANKIKKLFKKHKIKI